MRSRFLPVLLVVALTVALAGCLVQSTIDEKGGGTMKVELRGEVNATVDKIKAAFQGPGVTITNATMDDEKNAVVEFTYTDFRTLGALKQFGNTVFTMTDDEKAKTRTASAVVKADRPVQLPADQLKHVGKDLTVSVTVPGEIVKTTGKHKGKSATWTIPINTLLGGTATTFSVTYKNSGPPLAALPAATPATPAAAAPAAATPADAAPATAAAATPQPKQ
jgi:LppM domain